MVDNVAERVVLFRLKNLNKTYGYTEIVFIPKRRIALETLTEVDRGNMEKHLNVWRGYFHYTK